MKQFDYSTCSVIGYVDEIRSNGNAYIDVLGFLDEDNDFVRLDSTNLLRQFPNRGKVFAYDFAKDYYDTKNELICLTVQPDKKGKDNQEYYVWDRSGNVYIYGKKLCKISGIIDDSISNIVSVLTKNNLLSISEDKYIYSKDRIYLIKRDLSDRLLYYWDDDNFDMVDCAGNTFVLGVYSMPSPDGMIDFTTDEQLIDWFVSKILKKQWAELVTNQDFKIVESQIRDILQNNKSLDQDVLEDRFDRILKIEHTFELTLSTLRDFSESPMFKASFDRAIEHYKKEFLESKIKANDEQYKKICDAQLKRIDDVIESTNERIKLAKEKILNDLKLLEDQRSDLYKEIDEAKLELEIAKEEVLSKRKEFDTERIKLDEIASRKDDILRDFSIIKDVLGISNQSLQDQSLIVKPNSRVIKSVGSSAIPMDSIRVYKKLLEETFKINEIEVPSIHNLVNTIAHYKIILVPSAEYAKIIMLASKRYFYLTEYVSAGWKSFEDLLSNGLYEMCVACEKNPNIMHYLLLQNINLSYVPNYMQPLIDLQTGVIDELPGYDKSFPNNLRIICTISDDVLIPLSKRSIMNLGCVEFVEHDFLKPIITTAGEQYGYLTPELLTKQNILGEAITNHYDQYLNG